MNADQREEEIRRRVDRWRALSLDGRLRLSGQIYGELADQSFLVEIIDELRRQLAHYERAPTAAAAMPVVPKEPGSATTAMLAIPASDPRCDDTWEAALTAAITHGDAALVNAMRANANPYETRARLTAALNALRHAPPTSLPPATAPQPPAEPPPFTVG